MFSVFESIMGKGKPAGLLFEAVNYADMFKDVCVRMGEPSVPEVNSAIGTARRIFKKNDRVIWYLRLWKIGFLVRQAKKNPEAFPPEYVQAVINDYAKKAKITPEFAANQGGIMYTDHRLVDNFEHYFSLDINDIKNYVFRFENPDVVLGTFRKMEEKWQAETKDAFEDNEAKPLMKFPDGTAWFSLGKAYCSKEAAAMGHCGNSPRSNTDDTILSLRLSVKKNGRTLVKPYLTFILDGDGFLTEMKGRFNKKPERAFHEHIVALLKSPIINGIKGGGYLPGNNFSLNDLDEDTRDELMAEKPELMGLYQRYTKFGFEDRTVQSMVRQRCGELNISVPVWEPGSRTLILDEWDSLESFVDAVDDDMVAHLLSALEEGTEDLPFDSLTPGMVAAVIEAMNHREYAGMMRRLGLKAVPANNPLYSRAVAKAIELLPHSEFYEDMFEAVKAAASDCDDYKQKIMDRLAEYLDVGWYFETQYNWVEADGLGPVKMFIDQEEFMSIITAENDDDDDDEYNYYYNILRRDGWMEVSSDSLSERRQEAGLADWDKSGSLAADPVIGAVEFRLVSFEAQAEQLPGFEAKPDGSAVRVDARVAAERFVRTAGL